MSKIRHVRQLAPLNDYACVIAPLRQFYMRMLRSKQEIMERIVRFNRNTIYQTDSLKQGNYCALNEEHVANSP